jgi:hypothetical protein
VLLGPIRRDTPELHHSTGAGLPCGLEVRVEGARYSGGLDCLGKKRGLDAMWGRLRIASLPANGSLFESP